MDHNFITMENTKIPDRIFFKIGEVAEIIGLKPYVLRFWETEFKELAPRKANNKQRKYTKQEIEMLLLIKKLLYEEKYTIGGAKKKLKELRSRTNQVPTPQQASTDIKTKHHEQLRQIKNQLIEIQKEMLSNFSEYDINPNA